MLNYYEFTAPPGADPVPLEGRMDVRVAVVGGGFAGLNTALGLAERGMDGVCLLEAERIGHGASGRNGGFVFAGYSLDETTLLKQQGPTRAGMLYNWTVAAVDRIRSRIDRYAIACDAVDAGVLWTNWFRDPRVLQARQRVLADRYGVHWKWISRDALRAMLRTSRYSDALFEPNALHLHPLKYAQGLARVAQEKGVRVHEASPVTALQRCGSGWRLRTPTGELHARHVVLACGGYLSGLQGRVDRAVLPIATYVMVTEPLGARLHEAIATRSAIYDSRFAFDYYRKLPDERLLWGGRISIRERPPRDVKRLLQQDLARVYPQLADVRIDYAWAGLMSYARHQMPQIGGDGHGLWWAQAFGGHGLAPTAVAGELLADAIANQGRDWQKLACYGLVPAWRPLGYLAAQASYWWLQSRDAWKTWSERT